MNIINKKENENQNKKFFQLLTEFRDEKTSKERLKIVYQYLGEIMGLDLTNLLDFQSKKIITPLKEKYTGLSSEIGKTLIFSTFEDNEDFAKKIGRDFIDVSYGYLGNYSENNWTNGKIYLEIDKDLKEVETLVFCKSVLATGCTALSHIGRVVSEYKPSKIIIISLVSSKLAIEEILREYKSYNLSFIIGEIDELNEDNYLSPGVGNIEERLLG